MPAAVPPSAPPPGLVAGTVGRVAAWRSAAGVVGWMVPLAVGLALAIGVAMRFVPAYGGYTWISPIWVFRGVALRAGFPTVAVAAWLLGCWTVPERRAELRGVLRTVFGRNRTEPRWPNWAGIALVGGVAAVAARAASPWYGALDLAAIGVIAVLLAHRDPDARAVRATLLDIGRVVAVFTAVSYLFTAVKACLFLLRAPADAVIVGFETTVFGEPPHRWVARAAATRPWLVNVFNETYFRLFDHMTVGSLFLLGARRHQDRERLWVGLAVCYILGGFTYYLLPGLGPCYFEPELYSFLERLMPSTHDAQAALLDNSLRMRGERSFVLPTYAFVACMPSLHMAHEFVLLYYSRASRPFFVLTAVFVTGTWIATLGLGWHYAVDALGGAALAALAVVVAERGAARLLPHVARPAAAPGWRALGTTGWIGLAILVMVLLAHGPTMRNTFVLDDVHLVLSARLHDLGDLVAVMTSGIHHLSGEPRLASIFRPLGGLASWVIWQTFRDYGPSHHLISVLLGAALLILLARFLRRLGVAPGVSLAVALLVALHPLTGEVVAYLSARDLVLAWIAWLFILAPPVEDPGRRARHWRIAVATAVASLLHESFLLIGVAAAALPSGGSGNGRVRGWFGAAAGHMLGVGVALAARGLATPNAWVLANPVETLWPVTRRAVGAALAPVGLSPLVTVEPGWSGFGVAVLLGAGVTVGAAALAARRVPEARCSALGAVLALTALLAQAYGARAVGVIADRGAFSLLVALTLALAPLAERVTVTLRSRLDPLRWRLLLVGGCALGFAALPLTWSGGLTYRDEAALARLLLLTNPDDPASRARAGLLLAREGDVDEAERHCRAAAGTPAVASDAELCLAFAAARRGRDEEAYARVAAIVERVPGRTQARLLLWHLLIKHQRRDEVRAWVTRLWPVVKDPPDMVGAVEYVNSTRRAVNPLLQPPKE